LLKQFFGYFILNIRTAKLECIFSLHHAVENHMLTAAPVAIHNPLCDGAEESGDGAGVVASGGNGAVVDETGVPPTDGAEVVAVVFVRSQSAFSLNRGG
jgi:hypothetical protein